MAKGLMENNKWYGRVGKGNFIPDLLIHMLTQKLKLQKPDALTTPLNWCAFAKRTLYHSILNALFKKK